MTREELVELRTSLGLSQRDLARRVGVSPRTVARWEEGLHPIGLVYEKVIRIQATAVKMARDREPS
jgi:transcriptional regulator with XRE-family HTH domain